MNDVDNMYECLCNNNKATLIRQKMNKIFQHLTTEHM